MKIWLFLIAICAFAQVQNTTTSGYRDDSLLKQKPPLKTVSTLPSAAANTNIVYVVTDGTSASDCTGGGGSTRALCISNGAAWVALGGGSSGSGSQVTFLNQSVTSGVLFTLTDNLNTAIKETVCQDHTTGTVVTLAPTNTLNTVTFTPSSSESLDCYVTTGGVGGTGATGATGATGPAGSNGTNGTNGTTTNGGIDCKDATGSTTAYTCPTPSPVPAGINPGILIIFVPQTTNTTTGPTLNVASLGITNIKATAAANVAIGALVGGTPYLLEYDGTRFVLASSTSSGPPAFSSITAGTNAAHLTMGTSGILDTSGTATINFATGGHTTPALVGLTASKPATCTVGEMYFASDATAGQNWFFCTATNTWTQQLNSGGGSLTNWVISTSSTSLVSIPNDAAPHAIPFDTNQAGSTGSMHSTSTNTSRFIAPSSGRYTANCVINWNSGTGHYFTMGFMVNGSSIGNFDQINSPVNPFLVQQASTLLNLSASDFVECFGELDAGGAAITPSTARMSLVQVQ